jgi:hypothetical protein
MMRGNTANSRGGQETSAPEKKRGMMRGGGTSRGGQAEAPLDGRQRCDKKLRRQRTRGNKTTSWGRLKA